jgi:hypothetical protein
MDVMTDKTVGIMRPQRPIGKLPASDSIKFCARNPPATFAAMRTAVAVPPRASK